MTVVAEQTTHRSGLYEGSMSHHRLRPSDHRFSYRMYYGLFDLDELPELDRQLRLFSHNSRNIFSLRDTTHGSDDGTGLRDWIEKQLADAEYEFELGRVQLLAFPTVAGYVFNPISIWWCFDTDGSLRAVLHEVRNTFGDKHSYLSEVDPEAPRQVFDKELHVSPFMDLDKTYSFRLSAPDETVGVWIREDDQEGKLFTASFVGRRVEFTDRQLARMFVRYPLITLKSVLSIHWQAIKLWRKKVRFHSRPQPPTDPVTIQKVVSE
ncbi:MAG: DUF1365 family protein [Verrucomicrobiales bacterium]|jgi:DUF1365 family protein